MYPVKTWSSREGENQNSFKSFVSKWLKWKLGRRPGHRSIWTVFVSRRIRLVSIFLASPPPLTLSPTVFLPFIPPHSPPLPSCPPPLLAATPPHHHIPMLTFLSTLKLPSPFLCSLFCKFIYVPFNQGYCRKIWLAALHQ